MGRKKAKRRATQRENLKVAFRSPCQCSVLLNYCFVLGGRLSRTVARRKGRAAGVAAMERGEVTERRGLVEKCKGLVVTWGRNL